MAPDRTAVRAGVGGLALAGLAAVPWGRVTAGVTGGRPDPSWSWPLFALASVVGFCFGVFAIWSAIKAWLRDDVMSTEAKVGVFLGFVTILFVVALGPCGPTACPPD
jgi:drug/metabolite transporter (DMT)-like permease